MCLKRLTAIVGFVECTGELGLCWGLVDLEKK